MITLLSFCSFPWWLAWLLPFLLGLLLGWGLWSRWKKKYDGIYADLQSDRSRINALEVDNDKLRDSISSLEDNKKRLKLKLKESEDMLETSKLRLNTSINRSDYDALKNDVKDWEAKYQEMIDARDNYTSIVSVLEKEYLNLQGGDVVVREVKDDSESEIIQELRQEMTDARDNYADIVSIFEKEYLKLQQSKSSAESSVSDDVLNNIQAQYKDMTDARDNYTSIVSTLEKEYLKLRGDKSPESEDWKTRFDEVNKTLEIALDDLETTKKENATLKDQSKMLSSDSTDEEPWKEKYEKLEDNIKELLNINSTWETEFNSLKAKYDEKHDMLSRMKDQVENLQLKYQDFDSILRDKDQEIEQLKNKSQEGGDEVIGSAISSIYDSIDQSNLQFIEGIGPAMESVLKDNGVTNLSDLGNSKTEGIQSILDSYGDKYRIIDPTTWVQQAGLASVGKWTELIALQKELDGGVASGTISPSKAEKMMIKLGIIKEYKQDDLTAIEGIGPATNRLLNASGINTWRELADSTTSQLQSILDDAGSKFQLVDPETWVKQATLAAEGRFDELREYQDYLDGGKERS